METIKGMIALLLVAVVVFVVVGSSDIRSQARYAAKLLKPAAAANVVTVGRKAGTKTETNVVHQVRQQNKNAKL